MNDLRGLLEVDFDNNILGAYGVLVLPMRLMCLVQVHLNEGPIEPGIRSMLCSCAMKRLMAPRGRATDIMGSHAFPKH